MPEVESIGKGREVRIKEKSLLGGYFLPQR